MNFDYMEEAVDSICKSLKNEPEKWVFETFTFHKKGSTTTYWIGLGSSINSISTERTNPQVFSYEQGERIKKYYDIAREKQANESQKKILAEFSKSSDVVNKTSNKKPWYKVW